MSTYLPGFLRPEREGALRLHSLRRPGVHLWLHVDGASLLSWDFIDFLYKPRNISLFSSLLCFLIYNILNCLSLSKSIAIANTVSPSGFPGSCRGWTPANKINIVKHRGWMEIKWKQSIPLQSQPKQNLKRKQNRGYALPTNVSTSSKSFSFLLPESSLVYYPFTPLLLEYGQLITNQIIKKCSLLG